MVIPLEASVSDPVKRSDWQISPLPADHGRLPVELSFTLAEFAKTMRCHFVTGATRSQSNVMLFGGLPPANSFMSKTTIPLTPSTP